MNDLSTTGNDRIRPGGNLSPFDAITLEIEDLYLEAGQWADGSAIENQAQCDALDELDKALLDAGKRLDVVRVGEKKPLDDLIDAIQTRFNPFIQPKKGKVDIARAALNPLRAAFKERERQRLSAIAAQAAAEAAEVQRKAQEAMQASSGNLAAREEAERILNDAKIAQSDAKRTAKAATVGLGLRTYYRAELTDLNAAIRHYWPTHKAEFEQLVCDLASRQAGAGVTIPGFVIREERKAL